MSLSESLESIIAEVGVPERLKAFLLAQGVTTCAHLLDTVNDVGEVEAKIASKLEPPVTLLGEVAKIKNMYRLAKERGLQSL